MSCISALLLVHLRQVNFSRRALNRANKGRVATVNNFETASKLLSVNLIHRRFVIEIVAHTPSLSLPFI